MPSVQYLILLADFGCRKVTEENVKRMKYKRLESFETGLAVCSKHILLNFQENLQH